MATGDTLCLQSVRDRLAVADGVKVAEEVGVWVGMSCVLACRGVGVGATGPPCWLGSDWGIDGRQSQFSQDFHALAPSASHASQL